jgi:hypothetical protein
MYTARKLWNNAIAAQRRAAATQQRKVNLVDMFALDEELAQWDSALPEVQGSERLAGMALAWHLRQRDPARAQRLSAEVTPCWTRCLSPKPPCIAPVCC